VGGEIIFGFPEKYQKAFTMIWTKLFELKSFYVDMPFSCLATTFFLTAS
jgi:hypothetical protein